MSTHRLCFRAKKYPYKLQFYYIKVVCEGGTCIKKITRVYYHDVLRPVILR